jgi:hypothetical protein
MYTDEDLEAIRLLSARIERRRRLGVMLMYAPGLFLALMMGLLLSAMAWASPAPGGGPALQQMPQWFQVSLLAVVLGGASRPFPQPRALF